MEQWVFMLVMDLWIPIVMIVLGVIFKKRAPKKINFIFGYRSSMSMKNEDTWIFAHRYWGKIISIIGVAFIPGSVLSMVLVFGSDADTVNLVGTCVCVVQALAITCSIIPVEYALKREFDSNGNRK